MTISRRALLAAIAALPAMRAAAHALPDSQLTLWRDSADLRFELVMPQHELLLALDPASKGHGPGPADAVLAGYIAKHIRFDFGNQTRPPQVASIRRGMANHPDVGRYETVTVSGTLPNAPKTLILHLDVITHQVRNHAIDVFTPGANREPKPIGRVHYDLAAKAILPLALPDF